MFQGVFHVERGGLAAYSAIDKQLGRQAARLVDKIIRGANPADLPRRAADDLRAPHHPQNGENTRTQRPALGAAASGSGGSNSACSTKAARRSPTRSKSLLPGACTGLELHRDADSSQQDESQRKPAIPG